MHPVTASPSFIPLLLSWAHAIPDKTCLHSYKPTHTCMVEQSVREKLAQLVIVPLATWLAQFFCNWLQLVIEISWIVCARSLAKRVFLWFIAGHKQRVVRPPHLLVAAPKRTGDVRRLWRASPRTPINVNQSNERGHRIRDRQFLPRTVESRLCYVLCVVNDWWKSIICWMRWMKLFWIDVCWN